jgi:Xaa-Pro aminopeptidase
MLFNKSRALAIMDYHKVDALIASGHENVTYCSQLPRMHGCMSDLVLYVVVPRQSDISPIVVISKNAVDLFLDIESWINEIKMWGEFYIFESEDVDYSNLSSLERRYADVVKESTVEPTAEEALQKTLREKGLHEGRLALDNSNMCAATFDAITLLLPAAEIIPGNDFFRQIRMVKTPDELDRLRKASQANEDGLQGILNSLQAGRTEREMAEIHDKAVIKAGGTPHHNSIQGGTRGALINSGSGPSDYTFKAGDLVRMDFDCSYSDYFSDIARTAVIGKPSKKAADYYRAVQNGLLAAEQTMKPGVTAGEIFKVVVSNVKKAGIPHFNRHHVGHGLGLECYDFPIIKANNETKLEEGTVINIETPYYEIGFGCAHAENSYIVTKTGCECIQKTDLELKIV